MGKFPEFVYEAVGTATFVIMGTCAADQAKEEFGLAWAGLAFGMVFALCHVTFSSHCEALFNPVLSVARYVAAGEDFAKLLQTIVAQYLGCVGGTSLLAVLGHAHMLSPSHGDWKFAQLVVTQAVSVAFIAFLFLADGTSAGLTAPMFYMLIVGASLMFGNAGMNPAQYFSNAFHNGLDAPSGNDVAYTLGPFIGALAGALIHTYRKDCGKGGS